MLIHLFAHPLVNKYLYAASHGPGTVLGDKDALVVKINNLSLHLKLFCRKLEDFVNPEDSHSINREGCVKVRCAERVGRWVQRLCDCNIEFFFLTRLNGGWPWRISGIEQGVYSNIELQIAQPKGMGRRWAMEDSMGREEMCGDQNQHSRSQINLCCNFKPNRSRLSITGWSHLDAYTNISHGKFFCEKSEIYKTQAVLFLFQILRSLKIKYNSLCLIQLFSYIYPKNHELNVEIFSLFPKSRMEESEFKFNRWIILFYRNQ